MTTDLSPNTTLSHYRIISKLGAGGMGEVYLAEDTSELARTVALKIVPAEVAKNKDRLQRFTQEARTVSNLNHPNILTVYEFGQTDSVSFISTEYIDGVTLRKHLSGRRLKLIDILDLTIQIVAALNAAHAAGVTHRDLKPENVMVRKDHIVKVLDFGLAKTSETSLPDEIDSEAGTKVFVQTEPGLVMGTVSYMSPEQSAGKPVDNRTDIWSVGVVLYEMLAGVLPFQGKIFIAKSSPSRKLNLHHFHKWLKACPNACKRLSENVSPKKKMSVIKPQKISPYNIAVVYAGLNDKDQAFEWLNRAYEARCFGMTQLKVETVVDNLRSDPRFKSLLKRMNLPD